MHWRACVYTRLGEGGSYIWAGEGGAERACAWAAGTGSSLHAGSSASASARLGRAAASMLSPEANRGPRRVRGRGQPGSCWPSGGRRGTGCSGSRGFPRTVRRAGGGEPGQGRWRDACFRKEGVGVSVSDEGGRAGGWTEGSLLTGAGTKGAGKHQGRPGPSLRWGLPVRTASPPSEAVFVKGQTGWFRWNQSLWHRHCHTDVLDPRWRWWCTPPAHGGVRETETGTETGTEIRGDSG